MALTPDLATTFPKLLLETIEAAAERAGTTRSKLLGSVLDRTFRDWKKGGRVTQEALAKLLRHLGSLLSADEKALLRDQHLRYEEIVRSDDARVRSDRMARTMRLPTAKAILDRILPLHDAGARLYDPAAFLVFMNDIVESRRRAGDYAEAFRRAQALSVVLIQQGSYLGISDERLFRGVLTRALETIAYTGYQTGDVWAIQWALALLNRLDTGEVDPQIRTVKFQVQSFLSFHRSDVRPGYIEAYECLSMKPTGVYPAMRCTGGCVLGGVVQHYLGCGAPLSYAPPLIGERPLEDLLQEHRELAITTRHDELYLNLSINAARAYWNSGALEQTERLLWEAQYARLRFEASGARYHFSFAKLDELTRAFAVQQSDQL